MAGAGWRQFVAAEVLTASQVQDYLQDQVVMDFASNAARTSALASPSQGMISYLTDSNSYWQYYEAYNSGTNPGGASVAGWYPQEGTLLFAGKRSNTGLSLTNAAYTNVTFNTFACAGSTSNTDTIQISSATAPATMTVRKAGWYQLTLSTKMGSFSSTAGTQRIVAVNRNSTTATTNNLGNLVTTTPGGDSTLVASNTVLLAANDVVRFWLYQDSGGAATSNDTNASIVYLRPASV
jgi:hypothetical protein